METRAMIDEQDGYTLFMDKNTDPMFIGQEFSAFPLPVDGMMKITSSSYDSDGFIKIRVKMIGDNDGKSKGSRP